MTPPMYRTLNKGDILRVRETAECWNWRGCLVYAAREYDGRGGAIRCEMFCPAPGGVHTTSAYFRPSELEFIAAQGEGRPL